MPPIIPRRYRRSGGDNVTLADIEKWKKAYDGNGWTVPKFVLFIEFALQKGYTVTLYDAQTTVSKYVVVYNGDAKYKVRFSNHKPSLHQEMKGDTDFYVGITNTEVNTARQAWLAMVQAIGEANAEKRNKM